ncbi:hypothetical protein D3C85_1684730 [compost metagenome]
MLGNRTNPLLYRPPGIGVGVDRKIIFARHGPEPLNVVGMLMCDQNAVYILTRQLTHSQQLVDPLGTEAGVNHQRCFPVSHHCHITGRTAGQHCK